jgi:peptidoglycan hydrolase CwlO-like protein
LKKLTEYATMKPFMSKQTSSTKLRTILTRHMTLVIAVIVLSTGITLPLVKADQFDQQIQNLQQQNAQNQSIVNGLQAQATSYQDAINKLQSQIDALQSAIEANQAKQADLKQKISAAQIQLDKQKELLGESVKAMYVQGQVSTLEMLASSNNLSDFVDKQVYQTSIQDKVKSILDTVTALKLELQAQNQQVEALLKDQQIQQNQLTSDQNQQAQLLAYNQSQQNQYNAQISANTSQIGDLRRQQAILNSQYNIGSLHSDPNHGGYPSEWANAPQDSLVDYWGMFNRECVSYTAFKVDQDFLAGRNSHDMPYWGGFGNANQWEADARAYGIPVDNNPTHGSIAISNAGAFGHAMYVEQASTINGQQAIYVSQYNAALDGQYSEGWRYTTGLVFLHF